MKKKALIFLTVALIATMTIFFVACDGYQDLPDWAFDSLREQDASRAADTDVRVASVNVLVHMKSWGGTPVKPRAQMFDEFLAHFSPDVVALQEMCKDWYKYLPSAIEDEYALVHGKKTKTNLMYNKNELTVVDSGYFEYSQKDSSGCRAVAWGVFDTKDGDRFAVTSTHFDLGSEDKKVQYRKSQIAELAAKVTELADKYDCPVFAAGDYNVLEGEDYGAGSNYSDAVKAIGADVRYIDGVEQIYDEQFVEQRKGNLWDHIFLRGSATVLNYRIITQPFFDYGNELAMTDHYPIMCDVKL